MKNLNEIKIGNIYAMTKFWFFVFPTVESLEKICDKRTVVFGGCDDSEETVQQYCEIYAEDWGCTVEYLCPDETFIIVDVILEKKCVKILGSDKMGWLNLRYAEDEVGDVALLVEVKEPTNVYFGDSNG